jgi:cell division protease FtsH
MVTEYCMSARIGSVKLGTGSGEPFMGRDMGATREYSYELAKIIDEEIRVLIDQAHDEAWQMLNVNRKVLDKLARELLEKETLDHVQLEKIFTGIAKLPERPQWLSSDARPVSQLPPIKVPKKAVVAAEATDGNDGTPAKPARKPRPRKLPGVATA